MFKHEAQNATPDAVFARMAGMDANLIEGRPVSGFDFAARRPRNIALISERAVNLLRKLDAAIARFLRECEIEWRSTFNHEPVPAVTSLALATAASSSS